MDIDHSRRLSQLRQLVLMAACAVLVMPNCGRGAAPQWAGTGAHRLLVRVEPMNLGQRPADEMPAELQIDLAAELSRLGVGLPRCDEKGGSTMGADHSRVADDDLFLPSTQGSCLFERSFLEHGYAQARLLAVERK